MNHDRNELTRSWPQAPAEHPRGPLVAMPGPGEVLAGRFELIRELGSGGSGAVFAAHDRVLGQRVAVKVIFPTAGSPRTMERLRREVRAARSPHPNAASVFDLHTADGLSFLTMELVEGESLRDRLATDAALGVAEVVSIGRQAAAALAHLHRQGLIHRDVKPGNLLLTPAGQVKLCDMGLVRTLASHHSLTETATTVGTPAYMAPEQATGEELTPGADVYGLGLTLWQCLTGKVPLERDTAVATLMARQRQRPLPIRRQRRDCPRWLDRLMRWMLEPDPRARPTAAQVEAALKTQRTRYPIRLTPRPLAAAFAVVLATAAVPIALRAHHGEVTRTEVSGSVVRGVDDAGRTVWSRDLGAPLRQPVPVDLDGDGVDERALLPKKPRDVSTNPVLPTARLTVLDREGRVRVAATPADLLDMWSPEYNRSVVPELFPVDLDHDGRTELAVVVRHPTYFPSAVLLYWPKMQRWEQVLYHSGHVYAVTALPGDPPRLRFLAYGNRLAMLPVIGEIAVEVPHDGDGPSDSLQTPEVVLRDTSSYHWRYYTPLVPPRPDAALTPGFELTVGPDGGSAYHFLASAGRVDQLGNPVPGPNAGRDLRSLRRWFLIQLVGLRWSGDEVAFLSPDGVRAVKTTLEARAGPLLAEEPYRVLLGLAVGRALARAGDLDGGLAQLRRTAAELPYEDVVYRLAHLVALTGDLDGAQRVLTLPLSACSGARAGFDTPILRLRLSMEQRNRDAASREIGFLMAGAPTKLRDRMAAALWARLHLWWDECTAADGRATSMPWTPAGAAVACLARWRNGTTRTEDPAAMARLAREIPDAAFEARLARGAAQLALGRSDDALATLDATAAALEPVARDDFLQRQLYDLARALRLEALLATGARARARREAAALLPQLSPDVLPAILAREVAGGEE